MEIGLYPINLLYSKSSESKCALLFGLVNVRGCIQCSGFVVIREALAQVKLTSLVGVVNPNWMVSMETGDPLEHHVTESYHVSRLVHYCNYTHQVSSIFLLYCAAKI